MITREPVQADQLRIVPACAASWEDVDAVLGAAKCHGGRCFCQRFKIPDSQWRAVGDEERAHRLREQTGCGGCIDDDSPDRDGPDRGDGAAASTSGLVAFLDGEPVGWCAVEPRTEFANLLRNRMPWAGGAEDKNDAGVWAVTCFIIRPGFRGCGITYALARAAVGHARAGGARAVEGYAMVTTPGKPVS